MVKGPHAHTHSVWLYWGVFGVLIFLTAATVSLAQFDFGRLNIVVTLLIAGTKAALVMGIFMHLAYDNKFFAVIATTSLVFLALFITFPMIDLDTRSDLAPEQANFLPRDERVHQHELDNVAGLPLRPGLVEAKKDDLIFKGPGEH